ncbi:hypothetical protein AgCh_039217 [Apium graveolens]
MWRSIVAAQDLWKQGCRKRIGTGMETFVWKIPWLPCATDGFISTNIPTDFPNIKVSDLVNDRDKSWDDTMLNNLFIERDIRLIKQIPLASTERRDSWMWLFDSKGEFTVKSGYRQQWSWCRVEKEDVKHALFDYRFARSVWTAAGLENWVQTCHGESFMEHFNRLFISGTKEQCASLALFCWSIGNRRNRSPIATHGNTRRWQALMQTWVKINVDATIFGDAETIGVGGVVWDDQGKFLRAMCNQLSGSQTPIEAEALSLKKVLSWAKNFGYVHFNIKTDSKLLVDAYSGTTPRSYFHSIVNDCVELVKHFENVIVPFVPRSVNKVVHLLAKVSHFMSGLQECEDVVPNFLSDVITFDLI